MVYEAFRNLTEGFRLIPPSDRMVEGERWRVSVLTDSLHPSRESTPSSRAMPPSASSNVRAVPLRFPRGESP